MRVLLDNNVTQRLAPFLVGHEVVHARQLGWADLKNGELIAAAEREGCAAMLTADRNMQYQQNIKTRQIGILLLRNYRITLAHLMPLIPNILVALQDLPTGAFVTITTEEIIR